MRFILGEVKAIAITDLAESARELGVMPATKDKWIENLVGLKTPVDSRPFVLCVDDARIKREDVISADDRVCLFNV